MASSRHWQNLLRRRPTVWGHSLTFLRDLQIIQTLGASQNDLRPHNLISGSLGAPTEGLQTLALLGSEDDR